MTLFPEMIDHAVRFGVVGQAIKQAKITVLSRSPRDFTTNVHQTIDDRPYGGGDGMIMMSEPVAMTLAAMKESAPQARVIHLSPRGRPFDDQTAQRLAKFDEVILISSRYGGLDERLIQAEIDEEISIGDYILSGGELAALVLIDAVSRLLPGVLGNALSSEAESFRNERLEAPQYTRPREWRKESVPEVLLSGDHAKIARWRRGVSLLLTLERRPDLITNADTDELRAAEELMKLSSGDLRQLGIQDSEHLRQRMKDLSQKGGTT